MKTMCFTGRRPKDLFGYDKNAYIPMMEALKNALREHISNNYTRFISGGAQGFDQLAFWAINRLKEEGHNITNIVYVPFKGQERIWRPEGLFSQKDYRLMLKLADEVVIITEGDVTSKYDIIKAMHERNHAMVAEADAVFGLFPDMSWKESTTKGGTAECLKYAATKKKPIFQLSNTTLDSWWINNT